MSGYVRLICRKYKSTMRLGAAMFSYGEAQNTYTEKLGIWCSIQLSYGAFQDCAGRLRTGRSLNPQA